VAAAMEDLWRWWCCEVVKRIASDVSKASESFCTFLDLEQIQLGIY
jgi:hypothetical protein